MVKDVRKLNVIYMVVGKLNIIAILVWWWWRQDNIYPGA